jgi:hypothetical protein
MQVRKFGSPFTSYRKILFPCVSGFACRIKIVAEIHKLPISQVIVHRFIYNPIAYENAAINMMIFQKLSQLFANSSSLLSGWMSELVKR